MGYPAESRFHDADAAGVFNTAAENDAWWYVDPDPTTGGPVTVCAMSAVGMIVQLQRLLAAALPGPWTSYDGTHDLPPAITGVWGPETSAALYAVMQSLGTVPAMAALPAIYQMAQRAVVNHLSEVTEPEITRLVLWYLYGRAGGLLAALDAKGSAGQTPVDRFRLPDGHLVGFVLDAPFPSALTTADLDALAAKLPACSDLPGSAKASKDVLQFLDASAPPATGSPGDLGVTTPTKPAPAPGPAPTSSGGFWGKAILAVVGGYLVFGGD